MNDVNPSESTLRAFSVSDLSLSLKRTLEDTFTHVRVKGEISGCKAHSSGHLYFSLKDEGAVLDSVCWRGVASKLSVKPEDGMEVICTGKITTYAGRSKYQIVVDSMEASGQGALLKLLEERKKKLSEEGVFDLDRKKALPYLPQKIGVITSPTGAVIRDILHRLSDRMPAHVIVWPVAVQGATAHLEVSKAIAGFNLLNDRPDLLIVARGGGSLEDLWAFNEEEVVRAVSNSEIPLISAVGHETDTTLIDYVSDYRAPTPTAAAERAVPVRADLLSSLLNSQSRMMNGIQRLLQEMGIRIESLSRGVPQLSKITEEYQQRLDDWGDRFQNSYKQLLSVKKTKWESLIRLMESFSYQSVLERGFTIVKDDKGHPITLKKDTKSGMGIEITFQDGVQQAVIGKGTSRKPPGKKPKTNPSPSKQMGFWEK